MKKYILAFFVFTITGIIGFAADTQTIELKNSTQKALTPTKMDEIQQKNQRRFAALKKLNLPVGQYAVIGSGPLGIRNLREIGDIDIVVSPELQKILAAKYGVTDDGQVKKSFSLKTTLKRFGRGHFTHEKTKILHQLWPKLLLKQILLKACHLNHLNMFFILNVK